ncbi:MAG: hypothetical protein ACOH5I_13160 [Oligoflexus sp.]
MTRLLGWYAFLLAMATTVTSFSLLHAEPISYDMSFAMAETDITEGIPIEVEAKIKLPTARDEVCLYLAYNDPLYFYDPSQDLGKPQALGEMRLPKQGRIAIKKASYDFEELTPALVRIKDRQNLQEVALNFEFVVPRWPDRLGNQFLFQQFYPQILEECPQTEQLSYQWQRVRDVNYQASLKWPRSWQLTTPHQFMEPQVLRSQDSMVFNLSKNYRITSFNLKDLTVQMVYLSDDFPDHELYVRNFLVSLQSTFGDFPYRKLLLIESEDLERSRIPGVITLNRPKQAAMQTLQQGYLNWISWQLGFLLAEQWMGTSVSPKTYDDYWFFRGTSEFAASIGIQHEPTIRNLFANDDTGTPFLRLTYHQGADLAAALMQLFKPGQSLLKPESMETYDSYLHQYPYAYFRHVLAMRYLHWLYGESFLTAIREFYAENVNKRVSHLDFLNFLKDQPGLTMGGFSADEILKNWWTISDWPNFSLERVKVLDHPAIPGEKQVEVEIKQSIAIPLPVDVVMTTKRGRRLKEIVFSGEETATVKFDLLADEQPDIVEINPNREIFDRDRFDNSNRHLRFKFFPGNADGLADDAYTLVWVPFPALLPGEPLTFNLGLQMFRYVSAGVSGVISYNPQENRLGYVFYYTADLPSLGSQLEGKLVQDYGQTYKASRVAAISLARSPLFLRDPEFGLALRISFRETIAQADSRHMLAGLRASLTSKRTHLCSYLLYAERHQTFASMAEFDYTKDWGVAQFSCAGKGMELRLRGFAGKIVGEGNFPGGIRFNPQSLDEARIRIDRPNFVSANAITSFGADFSWPAYLPLPSSLFVLPRQSRWKLFYDYGESFGPDEIYTTGGFGFTLPFGGDVVGKSSMSFLNFTLMGVFYRRYGDTVSYEPGVIFDFLGEL